MSTDTFTASMQRSQALQASLDQASGRHRMLTGDRPTGHLHIGHYLASLRNRVALQNAGVESFVVIADYQVITDREGVGAVREHVLSLLTDYLAAGLDPARSIIFAHSAVPELNQLMLPFLALVTQAELERNPTVKEEATVSGRPVSGLLLTYPVHQAADILFCHADVVPVGRDQLPHVEQARVIARRFNQRFAGGAIVFREPVALLTAQPLILGVDGQKMSKSRGNAIELRASTDDTAALIRSARTDSERRITYEPERRPAVANLIDIAAAFTGTPPQQIAADLAGQGAAALKAMVTEAVTEGLRELRQRRTALAADPAYLLQVLRAGNAAARTVAETTSRQVHHAMGMIY